MVLSFMLFCRTYVFPRFLNPERAEHFVKLAKARLAPSSLAFKKGDTADTTKYVSSLTIRTAHHPRTRPFSVCMVILLALILHLSTTLRPIWSTLDLDDYPKNTAKHAYHITPASYIFVDEYMPFQQLLDAAKKW